MCCVCVLRNSEQIVFLARLRGQKESTEKLGEVDAWTILDTQKY